MRFQSKRIEELGDRGVSRVRSREEVGARVR